MDFLLPALLCTVAIVLWAGAVLPEYLVALLFFAGATVLHVAPPEVVFSGFFSAAFWLVLSGFVLGTAIRKVGLALAVGFGTFQLSTSILPANVPNLVMAGAAEAAYGVHLAYLSYLALHAPVLGVLKGALLIGCIAKCPLGTA